MHTSVLLLLTALASQSRATYVAEEDNHGDISTCMYADSSVCPRDQSWPQHSPLAVSAKMLPLTDTKATSTKAGLSPRLAGLLRAWPFERDTPGNGDDTEAPRALTKRADRATSASDPCAVTQIIDGQVQAPASCFSSAGKPSATASTKTGQGASSTRPGQSVSSTASQPGQGGNGSSGAKSTSNGSTGTKSPAMSPTGPSKSGATAGNCAVTQIGDGQIQAPASCYSSAGGSSMSTLTKPVSGAITSKTASSTAASASGGGQGLSTITAPTTGGANCAITQIGDGQIQAPASCFSSAGSALVITMTQPYTGTTTVSKLGVSTSSPNAGSGSPTTTPMAGSGGNCAITQIVDGQIQAPASCLSTGGSMKTVVTLMTYLVPAPPTATPSATLSATPSASPSSANTSVVSKSASMATVTSGQGSSATQGSSQSTPTAVSGVGSGRTTAGSSTPTPKYAMSNDASVEDAGAALAVVGSMLQLVAIMTFLYVDFAM